MKKSKDFYYLDFYYLGAKCWNSVPSHIRETDDIKKFSKCFKAEMLNSITSDLSYRINNGYDYIYKPTSLQINLDPIDTKTTKILQSIEALFSAN